MSRQPFDEAELGGEAHELEDVATTLERYAASLDAPPPADLTERIVAAVDLEPTPRRGWGTALAALLGDPFGSGARVLATAALATVVVAGALLAGQLMDVIRDADVGATPSPQATPSQSPLATEEPTRSPSPSPSATERVTPSPSAEESPSQTPQPSPSASDDDDDDHSGPGGGGGGDDGDDDGGDHSGPGGGDGADD